MSWALVLVDLDDHASDSDSPCPDGHRFLAPQFRWVALLDHLRAAEHTGHTAPHPETEDLQQEFGRAITGTTIEEQIGTVTGWLLSELQDPDGTRNVMLGDRRPSRLEHLVGSQTGAEDWAEKAHATLAAHLLGAEWATSLLVTFSGAEPSK